MGKIVTILMDRENKLQLVGGIEKNEVTEGDTREYMQGLSIFLNGERMVSLVTLEDDVEMLKSDIKVKGFSDLGYKLLANESYLEILIVGSDSGFNTFKQVREFPIKGNGGYASSCLVAEFVFCSNQCSFAEALKIAMSNPIEGDNLWNRIPEDVEEVVLIGGIK